MTFFDQNNFGHFYRLQYTMNQKNLTQLLGGVSGVPGAQI